MILVDISDQDDDQLKKLPSIVLDADCRKSTVDIFCMLLFRMFLGFCILILKPANKKSMIGNLGSPETILINIGPARDFFLK